MTYDLTTLWFPKFSTIVCEPDYSLAENSRWSERHIQCIWASEKLRPHALYAATGDAVVVKDPGRWNLEAGPDFLGAEIQIGARTLRGDVEIHVRQNDWHAHRHTDDPRYANVVLHVTWFPPSGAAHTLPAHIAAVSLRDAVLAQPGFSFESIDLTAFPYAEIPATPRPCGNALASCGTAQIAELLTEAGLSRLRRKAVRLAVRLHTTGSKYRVFYEELMGALGYKNNTDAFKKTAARLPLEKLVEFRDTATRYAVLLGAAGRLPEPEKQKTDAQKTYARTLWDIAWKNGFADTGAVAESPKWNMSGMRPTNHPVRRLAAAAALFDSETALWDAIENADKSDAAAWVKTVSEILQRKADAARDMVFGGSAASGDTETTLLGASRIAAILTNVVVPMLVVQDPDNAHLFAALPGETTGAPMREAAFRLLGRDHNPALYRSNGVMQQGLLEVWNRFCLSTKETCADCRLVSELGRKFVQ